MHIAPRPIGITLLATALALASATPSAWAQAKSFEGVDLSIQLGLHDVTSTRTFLIGSTKKHSSNYTAQAQYSFALGEKFVLGLGAWGFINDLQLNDIDYYNGTTSPLKVKDMYSVYLAPGYAVSDSVLVYGKVGTLYGKWAETPMTLNLSGTSLGLGVQIMGNSNLLYRLEILQNKFDNKDFLHPSGAGEGSTQLDMTSFNAGMGYKF